MKTQIAHLCRPVVTVDMDTLVDEVMNDVSWDNVSSAVVIDKDKKVIGIITEKDLVHINATGMNTEKLKVSDVCSKDIIKVSPEDSIVGAAHLMIDNQVHHVLIMVGDYVEGIISTLDVLEQLLDGH